MSTELAILPSAVLPEQQTDRPPRLELQDVVREPLPAALSLARQELDRAQPDQNPDEISVRAFAYFIEAGVRELTERADARSPGTPRSVINFLMGLDEEITTNPELIEETTADLASLHGGGVRLQASANSESIAELHGRDPETEERIRSAIEEAIYVVPPIDRERLPNYQDAMGKLATVPRRH